MNLVNGGGWVGGRGQGAGKLGPFIYFIAKQSIMAQIWCVCGGGGGCGDGNLQKVFSDGF